MSTTIIAKSLPHQPKVSMRPGNSNPHQVCARWPDDGTDHAHAVFWATTDGRIVLKGLVSNGLARGRSMLQWISKAYGRPIHVVEVLPSSKGFWNRMLAEGTISGWDPSDGHASPLERMAEPTRTRTREIVA